MSTSTLLGLTSKDLLHSIELQADINLRNTLQKPTGLIKGYELKGTNGRVKSLAEIRCEARVERFVNPHKRESHKTIDNNDVSVVTPNSKIDSNKNNRWYRKKYWQHLLQMINQMQLYRPVNHTVKRIRK